MSLQSTLANHAAFKVFEYDSEDYRDVLRKHGMVGSMSRNNN